MAGRKLGPYVRHGTHSIVCQVVASLSVSLVLMGFKISAVEGLVQANQRRTELETALELLQPRLEEEDLAVFLDDLHQDATQRQARIGELASPSSRVYSTMENEAIDTFLDMLRPFDGSSASTNRPETKQDAATGRLYGHSVAEVRADPQDIVAGMLNLDSRYLQSSNTANPRMVRNDMLGHVNAHHTIAFSRYKLPGIRDRTFMNSFIAKQLADDPRTYAVVVVPIPSHDKIGPKDEAGAVRAEIFRGFRLTAAAPGICRLEYCCSLDLRGRVPQWVTDKVATPAQMKVTAPCEAGACPAVTMLLHEGDCACCEAGACPAVGMLLHAPHAMRVGPFESDGSDAVARCRLRNRCSGTSSRSDRSARAMPRTDASLDAC